VKAAAAGSGVGLPSGREEEEGAAVGVTAGDCMGGTP
jgi:hypothetical protein